MTSLKKDRKCASSSRHAVIPIQLSTTANTAHSQFIRNRHHYRHTTNKRKDSHPHSHFATFQSKTSSYLLTVLQPLLISYKRDKNMSNLLVNSTLKSDHQPGTFKYARVRCRSKFRDLSDLSLSPIISRAFPPMLPTHVTTCTLCKKYTSAKRAADWVTVSRNALGMLRLTIKTLLNQSRDISISLTIPKNIWQFVAFLSI